MIKIDMNLILAVAAVLVTKTNKGKSISSSI